MIKRVAAALLLVFALAACKDDAPVATKYFRGSGSVSVVDARIVPTGDANPSLGGGTLTYYIFKLNYKNNERADFTPDVHRFFLTLPDGSRLQGTDNGSSALVGISNSIVPLKVGDTREYTVAFRGSAPNLTGAISYEP